MVWLLEATQKFIEKVYRNTVCAQHFFSFLKGLDLYIFRDPLPTPNLSTSLPPVTPDPVILNKKPLSSPRISQQSAFVLL